MTTAFYTNAPFDKVFYDAKMENYICIPHLHKEATPENCPAGRSLIYLGGFLPTPTWKSPDAPLAWVTDPVSGLRGYIPAHNPIFKLQLYKFM